MPWGQWATWDTQDSWGGGETDWATVPVELVTAAPDEITDPPEGS